MLQAIAHIIHMRDARRPHPAKTHNDHSDPLTAEAELAADFLSLGRTWIYPHPSLSMVVPAVLAPVSLPGRDNTWRWKENPSELHKSYRGCQSMVLRQKAILQTTAPKRAVLRGIIEAKSGQLTSKEDHYPPISQVAFYYFQTSAIHGSNHAKCHFQFFFLVSGNEILWTFKSKLSFPGKLKWSYFTISLLIVSGWLLQGTTRILKCKWDLQQRRASEC